MADFKGSFGIFRFNLTGQNGSLSTLIMRTIDGFRLWALRLNPGRQDLDLYGLSAINLLAKAWFNIGTYTFRVFVGFPVGARLRVFE